MERFEIVKIEKFDVYASAYINDKQEDISFWIDYWLTDGYGKRDNLQVGDLFTEWDFNQYIFNTDNSIDIKAKEYQENGDNIDALQEFIDEKNEELVAILRH